ncbi:MAG: hypothetical protein IJ368_02425 [Oscillospiraceae bacterium]|nr:hypothetical protein [Oscillospiraceae bacterium]
MLKIVKSRVYSFDSKPVQVGEIIPEETKSIAQAEEEEQPSPEELARIAEEERKRKLEEDAKRFNEAVIKRSDEIVAAKMKAMQANYQRLIDSGNANAERMLEDAKVKTRAVFEAANEECERLKELSRREGFEAGFEAGRTEAMKKCEKYLEAAAQLLTEINAKKEAYYISHEYELCETVMDMVRKITMNEIKTDPSVIDRICRNAAKNFRNSDYLKISVSKGEASKELITDSEFVKSLIPYIPEIEIEELEPEEAPAVTVELDNGSEIIDASVPTQLDFLREIMKSTRGGEEI